MKIYCARCELYLGQSSDDDDSYTVTCPICEDTIARTRFIISGLPMGELEYPNAEHFTWLGHVMHRHGEDDTAINFIRLTMERRETDFYVFPTPMKECSK